MSKKIRFDYNATKAYNQKKARTLSHSIADEKLMFKDGASLGSLSLDDETGETKRKIRRIVEKRVCKDYWKSQKAAGEDSNRDRAATRRNVSRTTKRIFGTNDFRCVC